MDWIGTIIIIKARLAKHGYHETVSKLNDAQMILGTPGEMYLEVINELLSIKDTSPGQYQLIEKEVKELLEFGKSINYFHSSD